MNLTGLYTSVLYLGCAFVVVYIISHYECYIRGYVSGRYGRKYDCNDYYKMLIFIFACLIGYYSLSYLYEK